MWNWNTDYSQFGPGSSFAPPFDAQTVRQDTF